MTSSWGYATSHTAVIVTLPSLARYENLTNGLLRSYRKGTAADMVSQAYIKNYASLLFALQTV